ncbi:hypothetical protein FA10DRAFT_266777 [Acaromyces ingoldii]|uniref:Mitochondrial distribution and morphology protein 12 n=1 Tax=Acaromyces ingoldii TaxID=215250 RepID=A0A316YM56_9BASI|nr:hypothetical protein FA10DRAFT_266777 [Acaromyces ingoldii]PWN90281.1 hypothetical protein FA10DRAFT_266777 [Acaromyces ingoldii]
MSLDLSWSLLDQTLQEGLREKLNSVLANASRPDFLGPISLVSLNLGSEAPDVCIVDVGDVWDGFLSRDDEEEEGTEGTGSRDAGRGSPLDGAYQDGDSSGRRHPTARRKRRGRTGSDLQVQGREYGHGSHEKPNNQFERFAEKNLPFAIDQNPPFSSSRRAGPQNDRLRLQTFRQYSSSEAQLVDSGSQYSVPVSGAGARGLGNTVPPSIVTGSGWAPSPGAAGAGAPWNWSAGLHGHAVQRRSSSHYGYPNGGLGGAAGAMVGANNGSMTPSGYFPAWAGAAGPLPMPPRPNDWRRASTSIARGISPPLHDTPEDMHPQAQTGKAESTTLPSVQLHLSLAWSTQAIRLTISTSLLVNHPSPAFMSLPMTITLTSLILQAGALLAFEGEDTTGRGRKAHFCLTVEEDEEQDPQAGQTGDEDLLSATDNEELSSDEQQSQQRRRALLLKKRQQIFSSAPPSSSSSSSYMPYFRPPTPGEKILPHITLETSVGQADKHVLKNVAKVERFVVDLIRKAIGDELVFPNFYSVELPR